MGKKILLVDDETSVRIMYQRMLSARGFETVEAESAEVGWEKFQEHKPDLVITDLKMPGEDGLWLAQRICQTDPHMPILLITAYADVSSAQRAVSLGIYEYYTKPVDLYQVLAGVHRGLEFRRLAQENKVYQQDLEHQVEVRTKELERVYQELLHSEKLSEVGRLAAGVVHEVLNPLTVVMGRLELVMLESALEERVKASLNTSHNHLKRAVKILNNLRDFSKQQNPKYESSDVNACLLQTIDLVAYETKKAHIEVETAFETFPNVLADIDQLAQVFLNLIKNAIEAMPNGGVLRVSTAFDSAQDQVKIIFSDTGEGIPDALQQQVFEMFYTTKKKGTGLGLGICRGIVASHQGTLNLCSKVGKGTSFIMALPISHQVLEGEPTETTV